MGIYNKVFETLACPRCGSESRMEFDLYFGYRNLIEYNMGDRYEWVQTSSLKKGGRPEGGNLDGEAYTVCPVCERDFFAIAKIRNDILESIEPDLSKRPHVPDGEKAV